MVQRTEYLQQLKVWKDEKVIKVVTGIRRCGKSTLLQQFQTYLKENGVAEEQIISINFEELEFEHLLSYRELYAYIKERLCEGKMTYIFLDEIQKVESFEKVVDSLYVKDNTDIYITGSNAYMLSGDLATYLTGRYIELTMLPLSFREYHELVGGEPERTFAEYMKTGGMPYVARMDRTTEKIDMYLEGIYNTVIIKDIEDRQARKESDPTKRKVTDVVLLKTIARYLASTIGSPISVKGVTDYLISNGRKVSANTVDDYMDALSESFIFYPVERF
ncbi:MAG: ATP-binding protein, partial [Oscillospiraceae bacterium]|nr:ATP-binding protein [Oscillospiraceae bacterium]